MGSNNLLVLILLVASAAYINGHAYFSSIAIDGVQHAENDCMRPHPGSQYDYPISSVDRPTGLTSNDMTCGWLPSAAKAANRKCPVNPGSKITIQWHYEMGLGTSDTFIIDPSHKGPCIVYMAKSETGSGSVWFKIFEDGYDQSTKKWCVDKLRANAGRFDVNIPTDITPGNYLFRVELIALHEGDRIGGAQPYVGCSELTVGGSGTVNPGNLVAIPGVYTATDPGIYFDIYTGKNPAYPIPGPTIYKSGSTGSNPPASVTTSRQSVTTAKPATSTTTTSTSTSTSGSRSSTTTTTTGRPATSTTTTTTSTSSSTSTSTSGSSSDAMCYLPGTPNLNGKVNANPGTCGKKAPRARCSDGQCCSQWGYCGPVANRDGTYSEYVDGRMRTVSKEFATQLYCNKTQGDYRKVPCNSIQGGIQSNEVVGSKEGNSATSILSLGGDIRSLMIIGVTFYCFFITYLF